MCDQVLILVVEVEDLLRVAVVEVLEIVGFVA
jgi:hypothetical protein